MAGPSQSLYHIGLRYAALASRPALIWLLVATGSSVAAVEVGSLMLVASLIGMAMSNEAHLQLYAAHFSERNRYNKALFRHLSDYLHALTTHILLSMLPALLACIVFFPKVNPVLAVGLALSERVADELLRFRLYKKQWTRWTSLLIAKSLAPAVAAIAALALLGEAVGLCYTLASLLFSLTLLGADGRPVRNALKIAISRLPNLAYIRSYLSSYFRVLSLRQVAAILSMNVVLLDRYVGMTIWSEHEVAYLLLAGQITNGIFFALEAKYLAENRANFINRDILLSDFWRWRPYLMLIALCAVTALIVLIFGSFLGILPSSSPTMRESVLFMIVNYALFYLSIPLNDYLYYRGQIMRLSLGHATFFVVYAISVIQVEALRSPSFSLSFLAMMLLLRLLLLAGSHRRLDRQAT